jgi:HSP20 family protein
MTIVTRHNPASPLTELIDWFDSGWPSAVPWHREDAHALRIEDRLDEDRYVVRAEIPGIDPDKDVRITVEHGVLTLSVERRESSRTATRTEFRYGSLLRRVTLPRGADEQNVVATYGDGILEVTVPIPPREEPRAIPVKPAAPAEVTATNVGEGVGEEPVPQNPSPGTEQG